MGFLASLLHPNAPFSTKFVSAIDQRLNYSSPPTCETLSSQKDCCLGCDYHDLFGTFPGMIEIRHANHAWVSGPVNSRNVNVKNLNGW